jgi:glycosyltransferase involved in cell wall biosynthesis
MRILLINTFYYPNIIGGTEISVKKLAEGLAKCGHDVSVLCTSENNAFEIINDVKVYRIRVKNLYAPIESKNQKAIKKCIYKLLEINNYFNIGIMDKKIKEIKPDVIHVNNIYGLSISLWKVLKKSNVPIIHTLRDYYLMCPKVNLISRGKICKNPKFVCRLFANYNKNIFKYDSCVTAPSQFTLNLFIEKGLIERKNTKLIYNAIDFDRKISEKILSNKIKRKGSLIRFVYLGGLDEHKGIKWLINAFKKINNKNINLSIAGKGKMENFIRQASEEDNRIKYLGYLNEEQINKLLYKSDVLIVPSIWYEPFGRVVIDAYRNIMPVIGSDIGGLSEIIEDKETGLLVKLNSENDLINAINKFSDRSVIKEKLSYCINKLFDFSLDNQVEQFEELYLKFIKDFKLNKNI